MYATNREKKTEQFAAKLVDFFLCLSHTA